jgi:hypothetical protein
MKSPLKIFAVLLICSIPIYFFWGHSPLVPNYGNFLQLIALIFATLACYRAQFIFPRNDPGRIAWGRLAFGSFIWVIAQLLEWYCEVVLRLVAYGTIADCFWTIGYIVLLMGFYQRLRIQWVRLKTSLMPQILLLTAIYAVLFYFQILPQLQMSNARFVEKLLDVAYPTFDFAMFAISALLLTIAWALKTPVKTPAAFCAGFALLLYADFILGSSTNVDSPLYVSTDLFYFSTYSLMAIAAEEELKVKLMSSNP